MTGECTGTPKRLVGNEAPNFAADGVRGDEFINVNLGTFNGKWKVLYFYPLDFTFVCPTEITAFSDNIAKFKEMNTEIIAVSTDSKFSHLAWVKQARSEGGLGKIDYPILADTNHKISRDYGVLLEEAGIALRGLFIIDDKNIIQHATINNLGVGRNIDEVLRLVEAFQYTAKHGEVCPANWKHGADSMKPDPKGSKTWFNKHGK